MWVGWCLFVQLVVFRYTCCFSSPDGIGSELLEGYGRGGRAFSLLKFGVCPVSASKLFLFHG